MKGDGVYGRLEHLRLLIMANYMNQIKRIVQNGYKCDGYNPDLELAFISLKIALIAYASTYKEFQHDFPLILLDKETDYTKISKNKKYQILYTETIIHFQHFFELTLKHFLRNSHPLLSDKIPYDNSLLLYKILNRQELSHDESMRLESIEFGETIKRIKTLRNQISDIEILNLMESDLTALSELNSLRNRIWHRGIFILNYDALDEFICGFIFPILKKILNIELFKSAETEWKYQRLACSLDPLNELFELSSSQKIDIGKLSMLKELCRSAYNNPLTMDNIDNEYIHDCENHLQREKYVELANIIVSATSGFVTECPVCKTGSLVNYIDYEGGIDTEKNIEYYTDRVSCTCCDFSLVRGFKNASEYNFNGIPDFNLS